MVKIISFVIVYIRGLIEFHGDPDSQSILYSGLNGTGKTAMLYAINFAITGIKYIPLHLEFDPDSGVEFFTHIDGIGKEKNARVEMELSYGGEGKTFRLVRYLNNPNEPKLIPNNSQTRKVLAELSAQHQLVLSRQNLLNFVKAQPTVRAEMLEAAFGKQKITAEREKLEYDLSRSISTLTAAQKLHYDSQINLSKCLNTDEINDENVLAIVNKHLRNLNMEELTTIPEDQIFLNEDSNKSNNYSTIMPKDSTSKNGLSKRLFEDDERFLESLQWYFQEYMLNNEKLDQAREEVAKVEAVKNEFNRISDVELNSVYDKIKQDFRKYYHFMIRESINVKESNLQVRLETKEGKLHFDVVFCDRGTFPPTALHSEGNQDVIGICMFLAIMNQERDGNVPIMLLDDILTSVDENYRDRVCKLLKKFFSETQIIATTHDRVMARHFRNQGLISNEVRLVGWDITTGPKIYQVENWQAKIRKLIEIGDYEVAAHQLRYHLEGIFYNLACDLGAMVSLRRDSQYGFGELKDAIVARVSNLIDGAKTRINNNLQEDPDKSESQANLDALKKFQRRFKKCVGRADYHQWLINVTLHNEEALMISKDELEATVIAYANLLNCLWCSKCNRWLDLRNITDAPTTLQCISDHMNTNLKLV